MLYSDRGATLRLAGRGGGGRGTISDLILGGGVTKHFFSLILYKFKNIGGHVPPPPPYSAVPVIIKVRNVQFQCRRTMNKTKARPRANAELLERGSVSGVASAFICFRTRPDQK